jgi:ATP-dependent Clp protease ATP-binding subunit ClpX
MADTNTTCSFCGKRASEVERLIAGPKVFICDGCVDACIEILSSDSKWLERQIANLR